MALRQGKDSEANSIFSNSLYIIGLFIILQTVFMSIVLFDLKMFFSIPENLLKDAFWLFGYTFIGYSLSLLRSVYATSLFAYNRLDILRLIEVFQNLLRIIIIISLFTTNGANLSYVGIANLFSSIVAFIITYYYFKKCTPQLKVKLREYNKEKIFELSGTSIWILINQMGALLLGNIDLYLVNKFLGGIATGQYAIVTQITSIFRTLAALVAGVASPLIMIYHAKNELENLKKAIIISSKLMIILVVVPMAIFIGFSAPLMSLWLGQEHADIYKLVSFALLFYIFAIPAMPLFNVNISYNKVKTPALMVVLLGIINIIMVYFLITKSSFGLWGVVYSKLPLEVFLTGIFIPLYVSKILSMKFIKLFKISIISLIFFALTYSLTSIVYHFLNIESLIMIIMCSFIIGIIILILYILFVFDSSEREIVFGGIHRKFNKSLQKETELDEN